MSGNQQEIQVCTSRDGIRIAYAVAGSGPPLVKAANWLSQLDFDWNSPVWRHWLAELSRNHTLVRYDERGTGLSDRDVEELTLDAFVADLEAVIDASGLDRFPLLGISQGGAIAITYAVRHPERVTHLILYGAYARGRRARAQTQKEHEECDLMIKMVELGWGQENPAFRQFFSTQFMPEGSPDQHRWLNELARISASPEGAARLMRATNMIDVRDYCSRISCPTLILHADGDVRVPFDEGRQLAGLIAGARLVPLQSRNHVLIADEPAWSRLVQEIRAFLPTNLEVTQAGALSGTVSTLTHRERQVLELIAQGIDNRQIAARLFLSEKTVKNHITSIFDKLAVETRAQAIVRARDAGLGANPLTESP